LPCILARHIRTFINIFFLMMICHSKKHGESGTRLIVQVIEVGTDSTDIFFGKGPLTHEGGRDGIQEQVILLNQLSMKLDEYFALRTFGPDQGRGG
jgi:hypothetical protein